MSAGVAGYRLLLRLRREEEVAGVGVGALSFSLWSGASAGPPVLAPAPPGRRPTPLVPLPTARHDGVSGLLGGAFWNHCRGHGGQAGLG